MRLLNQDSPIKSRYTSEYLNIYMSQQGVQTVEKKWIKGCYLWTTNLKGTNKNPLHKSLEALAWNDHTKTFSKNYLVKTALQFGRKYNNTNQGHPEGTHKIFHEDPLKATKFLYEDSPKELTGSLLKIQPIPSQRLESVRGSKTPAMQFALICTLEFECNSKEHATPHI